jgi:hypothetical protein
LLLAATAVALCLTGCGGGNSGDEGGTPAPRVGREFYGVIGAQPSPSPSELVRMGRGRVGTLRINLAWGSVQSGSDAGYDWRNYDPVIAEAARNDIRVLATVYSSPIWAEPTPEHPPLGDQLGPFEDFVRAAGRRYGSDGSFWRDHPDLPKLPIVDWELWNEPNSPLFWKPRPDVSGYLQLLRAFDGAVREADPNAQVILGGLWPTPKGGITMNRFISELYRRGGKGLFDAAAVHPYAANPQSALAITHDLRELMDRFGDRGRGIWITEVGWASAGAPSSLTVGPERQAEYLTRIFELAASARERLHLRGVIWYALRDTPGPLWPGHCGLFDLNGDPTPAWHAFTDLTGGSD